MLKPCIAQFACERPHCFLLNQPVSLRTLADSYFVHCENDIRLCWVVRRSQDFSALSACVYSTLLFCCRYIGDPKDQHQWLLLMYCSSQKPDIFDGFFKGSLGRKTYFPWKTSNVQTLSPVVKFDGSKKGSEEELFCAGLTPRSFWTFLNRLEKKMQVLILMALRIKW